MAPEFYSQVVTDGSSLFEKEQEQVDGMLVAIEPWRTQHRKDIDRLISRLYAHTGSVVPQRRRSRWMVAPGSRFKKGIFTKCFLIFRIFHVFSIKISFFYQNFNFFRFGRQTLVSGFRDPMQELTNLNVKQQLEKASLLFIGESQVWSLKPGITNAHLHTKGIDQSMFIQTVKPNVASLLESGSAIAAEAKRFNRPASVHVAMQEMAADRSLQSDLMREMFYQSKKGVLYFGEHIKQAIFLLI